MRAAMTEDRAVVTAACDEILDGFGIDEEALFREARRLRRRRWAIRALILLALVVVVAGAVWSSSGPGHAGTAHSDGTAGALPTGPVASLHVAGALAVGPTGALYVADVAGHRVLVRLRDGHYRVVAGNEHSGHSGDGGSALRAELSTVSELAFAPTGSLYLVDGGRVRVISPSGVIHTIAGNGQPARRMTADTPARSAALGSAQENAGPSIAIAPDGELYIATSVQLLGLTAHGTLEPVRDMAATKAVHGRLSGLGQIAVDGHRDIDVSGVNGWSVWQVTPNGRAHEVGPGSGARQSGGNTSVLQRAPGGTVYAENGPHILRVTTHRLVPAFTITTVDHEYFWPTSPSARTARSTSTRFQGIVASKPTSSSSWFATLTSLFSGKNATAVATTASGPANPAHRRAPRVRGLAVSLAKARRTARRLSALPRGAGACGVERPVSQSAHSEIALALRLVAGPGTTS